eukprot:1790176-Pyramimonas_sp.AAC.1
MTERGWSGSWVEFGNGNADAELVPGEGSEAGTLTLAASRGSEVSKKRLSLEEAAEFDEADAKEWKAIMDTQAVR